VAPIPDPQSVADKWVARSSAAAQDYAQGVARTDKDPTALAVQAGARYLANVQAAYASGKWARSLQRVGKAGWQQAVASKGAANFGTGVSAARDRVAAAFAPLLQFEQTLQAQVQGMPNVTDADRKARMLAWFDGMIRYRSQA
jgi:hypothetical protein